MHLAACVCVCVCVCVFLSPILPTLLLSGAEGVVSGDKACVCAQEGHVALVGETP